MTARSTFSFQARFASLFLILSLMLSLMLVGNSAFAATKKAKAKTNKAAIKQPPITAATKTVATQNLLIATKARNAYLVQQALKGGANVNVVDTKDVNLRTPLLWAAYNGDAACLKLLIAYKANVNAKDKLGETGLIFAAQRGYTDVAKALIAAKADLNAKDNNNMTALMYACKGAYIDTFNTILATNPQLNIQDLQGLTALMYVCQRTKAPGLDEMVGALISKGADVNVKDKIGNTALVWAIKNKRTDAVKALLAAKADVNVQVEGQNALYYATMINDTEMCNALRAAGAKF